MEVKACSKWMKQKTPDFKPKMNFGLANLSHVKEINQN